VSEWSDYRFFLAIARTGSLSAAARALGVDQSTVGRRLAALEHAVGARLFDRTPEGYVATADGDSVRAEVEALERGFLAVERRLAGGDARLDGIVRVATTQTFASVFLIPKLAALRARHPDLAIELVASNQPVDLARREADLAVRIGAAPKQPNLVVRRLGVARFAQYAAASYLASRGTPRSGTGLRGHDVVGYGGDLATAPLGRMLDEHAAHARVVFRANTIEAVHAAVASGLGIGVLPSFFETERRLKRVGAAALGSSPVWSVVHADLVRNARVRAVQRFIADVVERA